MYKHVTQILLVNHPSLLFQWSLSFEETFLFKHQNLWFDYYHTSLLLLGFHVGVLRVDLLWMTEQLSVLWILDIDEISDSY